MYRIRIYVKFTYKIRIFILELILKLKKHKRMEICGIGGIYVVRVLFVTFTKRYVFNNADLKDTFDKCRLKAIFLIQL